MHKQEIIRYLPKDEIGALLESLLHQLGFHIIKDTKTHYDAFRGEYETYTYRIEKPYTE